MYTVLTQEEILEEGGKKPALTFILKNLPLQVIGIQWLVSSPAEVVVSSTPPIIAEKTTSILKPPINLTEIAEEVISR